MDTAGVITADRFSTYGVSHQVVLAILLVGACLLVWIGRSYRGTDALERFDRVFAVAILVFTLPLQVRQLTPAQFDMDNSLPIQLCDLASVVAAYCLWTHRRWAAGLSFFWGFTLTIQAIVTPDVFYDFPAPEFVLYWGMHGLVVWAATYLTWGLGLSPTWRSYRLALAATAGWAVVVLGFNVVADTNYGFLMAKPDSASLLDLLGDWPWYLLAEAVIIASGWALLTWGWAGRGSRLLEQQR